MNIKTRNTVFIFLFLIVYPTLLYSQTLEDKKHEAYVRQSIKDALDGKGHSVTDSLIPNYETAVAIAEPILFKLYGRKNITSQRPYRHYLVDGYWCISGTLKKGWFGGVFEIIINGKDGKIVRVTHGK